MSEIEKMYENCGIEIPIVRLKIFKDDNGEMFTRPPFTAEKQIELIKWLAQKDYYTCDYCEIEPRKNGQEWLSYCHFKGSTSNTFEKALAGIVNEIWQDLTEEEKQQVKGILE